MSSSSERQYMLSSWYEIFEKRGITKSKVLLHYHNFYELIYIMDGTFITVIDGIRYCLKTGEFLLIDCAKIHQPDFEPSDTHDNHRIILWITRKMLQHISDDNTDLKQCFHAGTAFHFKNQETKTLSTLLQRILLLDRSHEDFGKQLLVKSVFTEFFVQFNRLCLSHDYKAPSNQKADTLFEKVGRYIDLHIEEPLSVEELSAAVFMSKYYFLRRFKSETSITAHDFLIHKRLIHACECIESGIPVSKVYLHCGFTDYSSFFRNFKARYHMSPKEYVRHIFSESL